MMNKSALLASTAVALVLVAASATAQMQQKEPQGATEPRAEQPQGKGSAQNEPKEKGKAPQSAEPKDEAPAEKSAEPKDKSKGTAATEPKGKATKGTAETAPQPQDKSPKGATAPEPKDKSKGTAGTATSPEPKDKASTGTAETTPQPQDKTTKGPGAAPKDKAAGAEPSKSGTGARVQLSEQQRTNVHQTILKDTRVNRVTNVNISINVGTRVPRSVRLAALPASVITLVPEYRSYQYFVIDDRICIVEPSTYEIVEVITVSGQTAMREDRGGTARLVLSDDERAIILREVDMSGGSTLALGALTEGSDVPRDIEVRAFPATVVEKVPKVRDYKFFTAENRLAIVDPEGAKVQLVIESRR